MCAVSSSSSSESIEGVGLEGEEDEEEVEDLMINLVDISTTIVKEGTHHQKILEFCLLPRSVFVMHCVAGVLKRKVLRKANKSSVSLARHRKIKYWVQLTDNCLVLHSSKPKPKKSVS